MWMVNSVMVPHRKYFGQTAMQFADLGARIIGGCCGTALIILQQYAPGSSDYTTSTVVLPDQQKRNRVSYCMKMWMSVPARGGQPYDCRSGQTASHGYR